MTRRQAEIVYGSIVGAAVGVSYMIGKAMWAGDATTAFDSTSPWQHWSARLPVP